MKLGRKAGLSRTFLPFFRVSERLTADINVGTVQGTSMFNQGSLHWMPAGALRTHTCDRQRNGQKRKSGHVMPRLTGLFLRDLLALFARL